MKRYAITLVIVTLFAAAAGASTWACWNTKGKDHLDKETAAFKTHGDILHACNFSPVVGSGTGVVFNADGTGFILKGYRMLQHRIPFNRARDTEIRWTLNKETGLLTILSETENGNVNTYRWYIIEIISENVWMIQPYGYYGTTQYKVTMWRIGSPEDLALRKWRNCRAGNKGKGFDAVDCENPLTENEVVAE